MIDRLRDVPEDEPIDPKGRMREDRDEEFLIFLCITPVHRINELEDMDNKHDRFIFEYRFIFREYHLYPFFEESLRVEFECLILLGNDGNILRSNSVGDFRCDIFDDPRLFFEFISESSLPDRSSSCSYCFELFHDSFEDISYIVRF